MRIAYALAALALLALPAATALPAVCGADCRIAASSFPGYDPPVAILASGSTITWHSTDNTHVTRDQTVGVPACFNVLGEGDSDAPGVRFDVVDGALHATSGGTTATCAGAVGASGGGFVLKYFCSLHPTMRAALVVTG